MNARLTASGALSFISFANVEWWHRRDQTPISRRTLSPVATHDLIAVGFCLGSSDSFRGRVPCLIVFRAVPKRRIKAPMRPADSKRKSSCEVATTVASQTPNPNQRHPTQNAPCRIMSSLPRKDRSPVNQLNNATTAKPNAMVEICSRLFIGQFLAISDFSKPSPVDIQQ
jgi:hypothetical protein